VAFLFNWYYIMLCMVLAAVAWATPFSSNPAEFKYVHVLAPGEIIDSDRVPAQIPSLFTADLNSPLLAIMPLLHARFLRRKERAASVARTPNTRKAFKKKLLMAKIQQYDARRAK